MYPKRQNTILSKRSYTSARNAPPIRGISGHRDHLKSLLINKFRTKYGANNRPELDLAIKNEVEGLLRQEKVYQTHLQTLETRLKNLVSAEKNKRKINSSLVAVDNKNELNLSSLKDPQTKKLNESSVLPSINRSQILNSASKNSQWAKIMEYDLVQYKEELKKNCEIENLKKKKIRNELEKQIREKMNAREAAKKSEYENDIVLLNKAKTEEEKELQKIYETKKKSVLEKSKLDQQLKCIFIHFL